MFKTITTVAVSATALFATLANAEAANLEAAQFADGTRLKRNLREVTSDPSRRRTAATAVEGTQALEALEGVQALEAVEYADAANAVRALQQEDIGLASGSAVADFKDALKLEQSALKSEPGTVSAADGPEQFYECGRRSSSAW